MPNLSRFDIQFDNPVAVYTPGETVSGKIVFCLNAPKIIREIKLKIRGKAEVYWTEHTGNGTIEYNKKEYYFKVLNELIGTKIGDKLTNLQAGQHSYPFSFRLPDEIPCSFQHEYGYILYTVKAILHEPCSFDRKIITPFTVLVPYDLRIQQKFVSPINEHFEEEFLEFCYFNAGSMKIHVSSRTRGFSPEDTIELIIRYNGSSTRVDITRMRSILLKRMSFYATSAFYSKTERRSVNLGEDHRTGCFGRKGEASLRLKVPPLPPANVQHCSIIDINYELDFIIEFSGMHSNVTRTYTVQLWDTLPIR